MLRRLFALLLFVPALAGCISTDEVQDPLGDAMDPVVPREIGWSLEGCEAVVGIVHVAKERLQPHVPEGWRVMAPEEQGGPQDPRGDAALGVEVFRCASATATNHSANQSAMKGAAYASYFTFVEPPEEYRRDDVTFHFWKWDTLVADETLRADLLAEGLPVRSGTADWDGEVNEAETFIAGPAGPNAFHVGLAWEEGAIGMSGVAGAPFEPKELSFVEYQATEDGRIVAWTTDVVGKHINIGVGYVKFNVGTWGHDVSGLERTPAYFFAADWSLTNGKLVIPPRSLGNETA